MNSVKRGRTKKKDTFHPPNQGTLGVCVRAGHIQPTPHATVNCPCGRSSDRPCRRQRGLAAAAAGILENVEEGPVVRRLGVPGQERVVAVSRLAARLTSASVAAQVAPAQVARNAALRLQVALFQVGRILDYVPQLSLYVVHVIRGAYHVLIALATLEQWRRLHFSEKL